ncbi:MAG: DUF262 domain-containing protein [Pseudomonadota bacterium]
MPSIETRTLTLGTMLQSHSYFVPKFQRDFSWDSEQIQQLWKDVNRTIDERTNTYFMGSIVLKLDQQRSRFEVIDGQQRLTTISLLLCALRDCARDNDHEAAADQLQRDFIARSEFDSDLPQAKLTLNQTNRHFYEENLILSADREFLLEARKDVGVRVTNRLIAKAFSYFRSEVDRLLERRTIAIGTYIREVINALNNVLQVIEIVVENDYDAYVLFETLNDRGLELSVADLLKNYLFRTAEDRVDDAQENWTLMASNLVGIETKRFLRHY